MKHYGLIGFPLSHSFSKKFFTEKFESERIKAKYENYPLEEISLFIDLIKNEPNLVGLNVTIPYKEKIIPYLHDMDKNAEEIEAVNTIKIVRSENDIFLKGFNTDVYGFEQSIKPLLKDYHTNALILGTGGASKAVNYVLQELGINTLFISRTKNGNAIDYASIDKKIMEKYKILINTTPVGTFPNVEEAPQIPYEYLSEQHLVYDLVYNPAITKFMELSNEHGATTKNGYEMLTLQALKAYEIWNE